MTDSGVPAQSEWQRGARRRGPSCLVLVLIGLALIAALIVALVVWLLSSGTLPVIFDLSTQHPDTVQSVNYSATTASGDLLVIITVPDVSEEEARAFHCNVVRLLLERHGRSAAVRIENPSQGYLLIDPPCDP